MWNHIFSCASISTSDCFTRSKALPIAASATGRGLSALGFQINVIALRPIYGSSLKRGFV